jgi:hypothetical protein
LKISIISPRPFLPGENLMLVCKQNGIIKAVLIAISPKKRKAFMQITGKFRTHSHTHKEGARVIMGPYLVIIDPCVTFHVHILTCSKPVKV